MLRPLFLTENESFLLAWLGFGLRDGGSSWNLVIASVTCFGFVWLGCETRLAADLPPSGLFVLGFTVASDIDFEVVLGLLRVLLDLIVDLVETSLLDLVTVFITGVAVAAGLSFLSL